MGPTHIRWPTAPRANAFVEHYELQPIDRQTNGPQLFYGLRYHTHIVKPGEVETFHDQVGYWLWEPATNAVMLTLGIPRGQVLLAGGDAEPDATEFEVRAEVGSEIYGILSNPFLDQAFRTLSYRMPVTRPPGRHLVLRGRGGTGHPRPRRALLPHRPQHPHPGGTAHTQPAWPRPLPQTEASASAIYETKAGCSHEPPHARAGPGHRRCVEHRSTQKASRSLKHYLAARRLVDFTGPLGWEYSAVDSRAGRRRWTAAPWARSRRPRARSCPWSSCGSPFSLAKSELAAADRGATDLDLDSVIAAGRAAALAEDHLVFHGYAQGAVAGIVAASPHQPVPISNDYSRYPEHVAKAVAALRAADVAGPYAIALGARCFTGVTETTEHGGYPVFEHLRQILEGPVVWAPAVDGAVVLSQRGGDFELTVGEDFSVGYRSDDATSVDLYIEESLTFRINTPDAAVHLAYAAEPRRPGQRARPEGRVRVAVLGPEVGGQSAWWHRSARPGQAVGVGRVVDGQSHRLGGEGLDLLVGEGEPHVVHGRGGLRAGQVGLVLRFGHRT